MSGNPDKPFESSLNFAALVEAVRQVHAYSAGVVNRVVNTSLTLRNWLIGCYIQHYGLHGADRAEYGDRLMDRLAKELVRSKVPASDRQRLYAYVAFYRTYPQVIEAIPEAWGSLFSSSSTLPGATIVRSLTGKSDGSVDAMEIVRSATGQSRTSGVLLVERLSYTHGNKLDLRAQHDMMTDASVKMSEQPSEKTRLKMRKDRM